MMTQHRWKSTWVSNTVVTNNAVSNTVVTLLALLAFEISVHGQAKAAPITPPAPAPNQILLAPNAPTYDIRRSAEGESLVVARFRYADGTEVLHPVGALLNGAEIPIEVVFLDAFTPAPQAIRIPIGSKVSDVAKLPPVRQSDLARNLDFAPQEPFRIRVRQRPGFAEPAVVQGDRTHWEVTAPTCLNNEWLGLARLRATTNTADVSAGATPSTEVQFGALKADLDAVVATQSDAIGRAQAAHTRAVFPRTQPYFLFGEYVCVSFNEGQGALPPSVSKP